MQSYLAPQILWNSEGQTLHIGMQNKEIAYSWLEYLSCTELLPLPLKIESAKAINEPRIRQEIISSCTYQQGINLVTEILYRGLDLNVTPPEIKRDINEFKRGDIVRILYNDTLSDRRVGKQATVIQIEQNVRHLHLEIDEHSHLWIKANWVSKIGHESLPPSLRWEKKEETAWTEYHLFANNIKTSIHIGKCRWKNYQVEIGIPKDKPYALFHNKQIIKSFDNLETAFAEGANYHGDALFANQTLRKY